MILKCISGAASRVGNVGVRASRDRFKNAARRHQRNPDEGALLVEVLVGMLILIVVFTATTVALSSMADQRVRIEQRDRALALIATYEEESRVFQCGYLVDRIDESLASAAGGTVDFQNIVDSCDFKAKADGLLNGENGGDQDFQVKEVINENFSEQTFQVSIRYWWEVAGSDLHQKDCTTIKSTTGTGLPLILTRAFRVQWNEGSGPPKEETLIKREPVPGDDVVFVSGNRVNILVPTPGVDPWFSALAPVVDPTSGVVDTSLHVRRHVDGMLGQPQLCVWYPYITSDGVGRSAAASGTEASLPNSTANVSGASIAGLEPQGFHQV